MEPLVDLFMSWVVPVIGGILGGIIANQCGLGVGSTVIAIIVGMFSLQILLVAIFVVAGKLRSPPHEP